MSVPTSSSRSPLMSALPAITWTCKKRRLVNSGPVRSAQLPAITSTYKRRRSLNSGLGNIALVDEEGVVHLEDLDVKKNCDFSTTARHDLPEVDCMEQIGKAAYDGIKNNNDLSHGVNVDVEGCGAFDHSYTCLNANKIVRKKQNYWPKINDRTKPKKIPKVKKVKPSKRNRHESEMPQACHVADDSVYVPRTPDPLDYKGINLGGSLGEESVTPIQTKRLWRTSGCLEKRSCRRAITFSDTMTDGRTNLVASFTDVDADKYKWIFESFNKDSEFQDFESCIGMKKIISEYKRGKFKSKRRSGIMIEDLKDALPLFSLSKQCLTPVKIPRKQRSKRNHTRKMLPVEVLTSLDATVTNSFKLSKKCLTPVKIPRKKRSKRNRTRKMLPVEVSTSLDATVTNSFKRTSVLGKCKYTPPSQLKNFALENVAFNTLEQKCWTQKLISKDHVWKERNSAWTPDVGSLDSAQREVYSALTPYVVDVVGSLDSAPMPGSDNALIPYGGRKKVDRGRKKVKKVDRGRKKVDNALIPHAERLHPLKYNVKVDICPNTIRVWNLLMENDGDLANSDGKTKNWLEEETKQLGERIDVFIACMNLIQGNRPFSYWRGSVVDSVFGVFLTQNVTDVLSSSSFMALAAKYPPKHRNGGCESSTSTIQEEEIEDMKVKPYNYWYLKGRAKAIAEAKERNDKKKIKKVISKFDGQSRRKKGKKVEKQDKGVYWEDLKQTYCTCTPRSYDSLDAVDWEAVRRASLEEVAEVIEGRGMHNLIAGRMKDLLDRLVKDHGSIDLEWLREVPPIKAKDYLLDIDGIGLKSAECIRLLSLDQHAFPVDTNIGRIAVRLGWVTLQPFPDGVLIHLLEKYPLMDHIQKYLWPRLQGLDKSKLFELHYHLITFGKVFCKKRRPNCNACPMKGDCRHFASAYASEKLSLPAPNKEACASDEGCNGYSTETPTPLLLQGSPSEPQHESICEPIVEVPSSPEPQCVETPIRDIEDLCSERDDYIPTIALNTEAFRKNVQMELERRNCMHHDLSKALVSLTHESASISMKKKRELRTEHVVYKLEDDHPLLARFEQRVPEDPNPYLVKVWTTDAEMEEQSDQMVLGTILIPCKTANKGRFPLSGTYFQTNEVFADEESSQNPISIPRNLLLNSNRRLLYCGASASSIFTDCDLQKITYSFWKGFICVRGVDKITIAPKTLAQRFHKRPIKKEDLVE